MKDTLINKAKNIAMKGSGRRSYSFKEGEAEELAVAWANREITFTQASGAIGATGSAAYSVLATALRRAYEKGLLK